jgi:hypothetical protein
VLSDKVVKSENENPNKIDKVPVKTHFLNHFVMLASFENSTICHNENNKVYYNARENVESVESRDEEKEICITLLSSIFILMHICSESK